MKQLQLQKVYNYPSCPRDSQIYSDKGFVKKDKECRGGTPWTCFVVKDGKPFYLDSFGGQPDKFLLKQLPKPIIYHNYKIQGMNSKICGSYCLYFFYLIERLKYYDAILKLVFE